MRSRASIFYGAMALAWCFVGMALSVLASHSEPISYVDASSSPDQDTFGDRHYKTISEALARPPQPHEKIIVRPGVYAEDPTINVEGVRLISERGAGQTKIIGQVTIAARHVRLEGFEIVGQDKPTALSLSGFGIQIVKNRLRAAQIGIHVQTHSQKIELQANEALANTVAGLQISGSRDVNVSDNAMRGNFGTGVVIEVSFGVALVSNRILLNQGAGVRMVKSQPAEIAQNVISGNGDAGLSLDEVSLVTITENEIVGNSVGISSVNTRSSQIVSNQIKLHRQGGLLLRNSKEVRIEDNEIEQNQGADSAGIRLEGESSVNEIIDNFITSNSIGIEFAESDGRGPSDNHLSQNEVSDSDGAGIAIAASEGQNVFDQANKIFGNSGSGILVLGAGNDIVKENSIHDNGSHGIHLQKTDKNTIARNKIFANGKSGIYLEEGRSNTFIENFLERNTEAGLALANASYTELRGNAVQENVQDGVRLHQGESLRLVENEILDNTRVGIALERVMNVTASGNVIRANRGGGVRLAKVADVDFQSNAIERNLQFGLLASEATNVNARRNYWGTAEGPAGGFTGQGNAVAGIAPSQIIPWLPSSASQLKLASVMGKLITDSGGDRVQFNAHDTTGMELALRELRQAGQDRVAAQALIVLARYAQVPVNVQTMSNGIGYYHVLVRGFDSGIAEFAIDYDAAELSTRGFSANQLRLYSFDFNKHQWDILPTTPQPDLSRMVAEARLDQLEGGVLVLALESTSADELASLFPPTTMPDSPKHTFSQESDLNSIPIQPAIGASTAATQMTDQAAAPGRQAPTALATTRRASVVTETPHKSSSDYWGFVFLFSTIFLSWSAVRIYRRHESKTHE